MLLNPGITDYLVLDPDGGLANSTSGTFNWVNAINIARGNAARNYPEAQGITMDGNILSFVCKQVQRLYQLNLDDMTYTMSSTVDGLLDGQPNELKTVQDGDETLMYITEVTEGGGRRAGVHVRTHTGEFYTVLEGFSRSNAAGLAFSPNGLHMYVGFKNQGVLLDITRDDGFSFFEEVTLDGTGEVTSDRTYIKSTGDNTYIKPGN
jgi:sugar lactone lactonase YvrE